MQPDSRPQCADPECDRVHVWHVAIAERAGLIRWWTDVLADTHGQAEAQARARGLYEAAELDGLEVAILRDIAPSWWSERYLSGAELRATLWSSVCEQLEGLLGDG